MPNEQWTGDVVTFAVTGVVDESLKRSGEYRDTVGNKIASGLGSGMLGALGAAMGGPALGVALGVLGHCIGQSSDFRDERAGDGEGLAAEPPPNVDYDSLPGSLFDYGNL